jgi:hypothetical protein
MNLKFKIMFAAVATTALSVPIVAIAAPKTSPSPSPSAHASPSEKTTTARAIPFHGKISAVDQTAKTFTIAGKEKSRVFKITDKTVITKAGAAATMKDVVANEDARGSYWKAADGSLEAKTVKLGPATDTKTTKKKSTTAEPSPSASPKP